MEKENHKRRFPWTYSSTQLLISIYGKNSLNLSLRYLYFYHCFHVFLGEYIGEFLDKYTNKSSLWRKVADLMKGSNILNDLEREEITANIILRKWIALKKVFKTFYYGLEKSDATTLTGFPYFKQMNKLFTDYAREKLNETIETTMNGTVANADITAFVMQILNDTYCEEDEFRKPQEPSSPKSRASRILEKIAVMPKSSISLHNTKLRVEPNTPFTSRYQLKTIVDRREYKPAMKRQTYSNWKNMKIKKQRLDSEADLKEITLIEAADDSSLYEVEVLDEYKNDYDVHVISDTSENNTMSSTFTSIAHSVVAESSTVASQSESTNYSELEVPSLSKFDNLQHSIDTMRDAVFLDPHESPILSTPQPPSFVRKLDWTDENHETEEPPKWFQSFLTHYDNDMKLITTQMAVVDEKLNKILAKHQPVISLNRGSLKVKNEAKPSL